VHDSTVTVAGVTPVGRTRNGAISSSNRGEITAKSLSFNRDARESLAAFRLEAHTFMDKAPLLEVLLATTEVSREISGASPCRILTFAPPRMLFGVLCSRARADTDPVLAFSSAALKRVAPAEFPDFFTLPANSLTRQVHSSRFSLRILFFRPHNPASRKERCQRRWPTIVVLPLWRRVTRDSCWEDRLIILENRFVALANANAFISTLGGGHFLCKQVSRARAMALAQRRVARALGNEGLEAMTLVHLVYTDIQVGNFRRAASTLRALRAYAERAGNGVLTNMVESGQRFCRRTYALWRAGLLDDRQGGFQGRRFAEVGHRPQPAATARTTTPEPDLARAAPVTAAGVVKPREILSEFTEAVGGGAAAAAADPALALTASLQRLDRSAGDRYDELYRLRLVVSAVK
jgi:hypothetical protein